MGETLQPVATGFNKCLRVESRAARLTGDAGAVVLREILERRSVRNSVYLAAGPVPI